MPIAFSCPHCGKSTTVADQFAGQSGPCAACGKTITIPAPSLPPSGGISGAAAGGAAAGGVLTAVIIGLVAVVGVLVVCGGILVALLLPAVQQARSAGRRMQSANNLKQMGIAIHMYHDMYNELPPAVVKDGSGKPLYSGMVLLLPFLEQDQIYRQFDLTKPWDADENRGLSMTDLAFLRNPNSPNPAPGTTDYLFVGGPQSLLGADGKRTFADCRDGTSNTMVLVEVKGNTRSWAEPAVWTPDQPLDSDTVNVVNVAMADGSVRAIDKNTPKQQLILLSNPSDGMPVNLP
ncbi:MAG TPA: DUF1559 domain-containing protein [Pirellulaceae bacterium]|nr:DUF1559 domain-containing protein [Pirellulaceae bacterium]